MSKKVTQGLVKELVAPEQGSSITWDTEISGFGVRITSAGAIAYVLEYSIRGRKRRFTIGRHPVLTAIAARDEAIDLLRGIRDGRDPLETREQDRDQPTINDLAADYLEKHAKVHKRPGSLRNDKGMLSNIILPRLGPLRVSAVTRRDIEQLHSSLKPTPYHANRVLALLLKMFGIAIDWGWITQNPVKGVPRFREDRRERWLSKEEMQRFINALNAYRDQSAANSLRLLMMTGAREMEALKALWSQFDLDRGTWTKPSHGTKEKKTEYVPLSDETLVFLRKMKSKANGSEALFPGRNGSDARATIRRPFKQICRSAGLVTEEQVQGKRHAITRYRPVLRLHDLRHNYASYLVSSGVSLPQVGKLLGHTRPETTQRYAHLQDEALRKATNVFGAIFKAAEKRQIQPPQARRRNERP